MGNDDVDTPTALVGKKIAPIWVDGRIETVANQIRFASLNQLLLTSGNFSKLRLLIK